MLPSFPFEILEPILWLTLIVLVLLIGVIILRRVINLIKTYTNRRRQDQIRQFLYELSENDRTVERMTSWLGRRPHYRIVALVKAVKHLERSELPDIRECLRGTIIGQFLGRCLTDSTNTWTRARAAWAIGELGFEDNTTALEKGLKDTNEDVRYASAQALSDLNTVESAFTLSRLIGTDTRFQNARIAGMFEGMTVDINDVVVEMIEDDDTERKIWGINLVGYCNLFDLVMKLKPLVENDDPEVRSAVVESLGELQVPMTDRWLQPLLDDNVWFVRSHLAKTLGKLEAEWAVPDLAEMLSSEKWWIRHNATEALIRIGEPSVDAVEDVLLGSRDRFARNCAVSVLERTSWVSEHVAKASHGHEDSIEVLRRFAACGGVGRLENELMEADPEHVPFLLDILKQFGDDATFGRIRAAAERMPEHLKKSALETARSIRE